MPERITYKGTSYDIVDNGLVSDFWRQHWRQSLSEPQAPSTRPPDEEHVAICTTWLEVHARPRKTANYKRGSYGLKHAVERESGQYVTNGAFILAAHRLGYEVIPDGLKNPNACFRASFTF